MEGRALSPEPVIGIVGGSGLYDIDGLDDKRWIAVESPWGRPSDEILHARLGAAEFRFLPRHGRGHRIGPTDLDNRANIDALKRSGATEIVSLSAVGSLREEHAPGDFVLVDQFIDRTVARAKSFFGAGCTAHVSMADPVCPRLAGLLAEAAGKAGVALHRGGTYLAMEGPQFSTRAESALYRTWGCAVIGMTAMPEAKLAREAELCYATVAMVTDYDCWHEEHEDVSVEAVIRVLLDNADKGRALVRHAAPALAGRRGLCYAGCHTALDHALITPPEHRDPALLAKLDAVAGRVLDPAA